MDVIQLTTESRSVISRVADGFQPIQRFTPVIGIDFDASVLVGTHRLLASPALAALQWMHIEPQPEQVQPGLRRLAALKAALDGQIWAQNAVDRLGSTTGAHHPFQDVKQPCGQLQCARIVSQAIAQAVA